MRRISLGSRLALLFAACTATVSLGAGLLFSRASEQHFVELDQQLLDSRLSLFRTQLADVSTADELQARLPALRDELSHQADLALRISASNGATWFESRSGLPQAALATGLATLHAQGIDYRSLSVPLKQGTMQSPQLTLYLDITHHQHFLQGMQRLIWLTVGLSALTTALLVPGPPAAACAHCGRWARWPPACQRVRSPPVCQWRRCPKSWPSWPAA